MQRLALLNFSALAALPPDQVLLHYLVAACDSADAAGGLKSYDSSQLWIR